MSVDVEESLSALLLADAAVSAIAGSNVFPNREPARGHLPCVVTQRTGGGPINGLNSTLGVRPAKFQVECWSAASQDEARRLGLAAQLALNGFRGLNTGWFIQKLLVNPDSDQDNPQIPVHGDDLGQFVSLFEIDVAYKPGA